MLGAKARAKISTITNPIAKVLIRLGISANVMTVIGMLLSVGSALWFFPQGHLFVGTLFIWLFVMFDMLDGAIARHEGGTAFGAVLDSTCDRITDGAVFGTLTYWAAVKENDSRLVAVLLVIGVLVQTISYVKSRAEGVGIAVDGGLIERTERLIIILVGSGLEGLHVPHALWIASIILLIGSIYTFFQRIYIVAKAPVS